MTRAERARQRGQGLVEFASLVPVFMLLLLGMLEFGFVFDQNLTLEYATREGARVGSALANGGGDLGCSAGQSPNAATVDPQILAAVQRVLLSPSSRVVPATSPAMVVTIWKATSAGQPVAGSVNTWTYTGPGTGPLVDGQQIGFTQGAVQWNACARKNGGVGGPDSIGVSLTHVYKFQTALAGILGFFGGPTANQLAISDRTVMALNPTD